jgi:exopolysaccharide production protein ExoZ
MAFHLPGYVGSGTGVWSLGVEALFYALFPGICLLARNSSRSAFLAALAVSVAGQVALFKIITPLYRQDPGAHFDFFNSFLMHSPFFLIGVLIYLLPKERIRGAFPAGIVVFIAAVGSSLLVKAPVFTTLPFFLALTAMCGISVGLLYRSEIPRFMAAPAAFLGNISYSIYLLHPLVYKGWTATGWNLSGPVSFVAFVTVAMGLSYLSYRFFEMPARNALRARKSQGSSPNSLPLASVQPPSG